MNFNLSAVITPVVSLLLAIQPAFAGSGNGRVRVVAPGRMPMTLGQGAATHLRMPTGRVSYATSPGRFTLGSSVRITGGLSLPTPLELTPSAELFTAPETKDVPKIPQNEVLQGVRSSVQTIQQAAIAGQSANVHLDTIYTGSRKSNGDDGVRAQSPDAGRSQFAPAKGSGVPVINNEGALVIGRAAVYFKAVMRWVKQWEVKVDLRSTLDVMHDTYRDVVIKMDSLLHLTKGHKVMAVNSHLDRTLEFVDGIADINGVKTAIHTHIVFAHPSPNPQSQIQEGNGRVDDYLKAALRYYAPGGVADRTLKLDPTNKKEGPIKKVILSFNTRGYKEIQAHIKQVTKEWDSRYDIRFTDDYMTPPISKESVVQRLNELTQKHAGSILRNIAEGVIYSRYVGLYLELKTIEVKVRQGHTILESGRDLLDSNGMYKTELDVVSRDPKKKAWINESKSARVDIPHKQVLDDKILYKLEKYLREMPLLNAKMGEGFGVNFPMGLEEVKVERNGETVREFSAKAKALKAYLDEQVRLLNIERPKELRTDAFPQAKYPFEITIEYISGYPDSK